MVASRISKLAIAGDILRASGKTTSARLPQAILEILEKHCPIAASTFYSFSDMGVPSNDRLTLRAQTGLSYQDFPSFLLPIESLATAAINSKKIRQVADIRRALHREQLQLAEKFNLTSMTIVPLYVDREGHETKIELPSTGRLAVLCLYSRDSSSLRQIRRVFHELTPIISEAYVQTIDVDKLRFREQVTQRAIASADVNSFLFRFSRILKENWPYEAVSVYIFDDRADILRLGASTGLRGRSTKKEIYIPLDDHTEIEAICFHKKVARLYFIDEEVERQSTRAELLTGAATARVFVPIFEPSDKASNVPPIGILRVTNKQLQHDHRVETVSFGWEDISFLRFAADVLGVIVSLFGRVARSKDDFERSLHGVQNNLNGVLGSLEFIRAQVERSQELRRYSYLLPTAKAQLQALVWQVEKFSGRDGMLVQGPSKCNLLPDVFAKLGPLIRSLGDSFNTRIRTLPDFNDVFGKSPPVAMPSTEAITVFRNLFENSVKYSHPDKHLEITCEISLDTKVDQIHIRYSDNGIGISDRDSGRIFHEGFRSEDAMRRCTIGAGLGLFQCRELLRQCGGDIALTSPRNPTEFLVSLPKWSEK